MNGYTINKPALFVTYPQKRTQQPSDVIGLLLLDGLVVQGLKEDIQHEKVVSANRRATQGS